jgi:hypothetical protein
LPSALQVHANEHSRSRLVSNPLRCFNKKSREGRAIRDLACRYLAQSSKDTSDPLTIGNAVAAAQYSLRLDGMRADPAAAAVDVARFEWCLRLRLRALGIDSGKRGNHPAIPSAAELLARGCK